MGILVQRHTFLSRVRAVVSHFFFTSLVQCFVTQLSIRQADRRQELSAVVSRAVSDARSGVGSAASDLISTLQIPFFPVGGLRLVRFLGNMS